MNDSKHGPIIKDYDNMPNKFEEWLDLNCKMSPIKHMEVKYSHDKPTNMYLTDYFEKSNKFGKPLSLDRADKRYPIFISAQTGTGKNYYMEYDILGPLLERNKKCDSVSDHERILLLSNRVALGRQSKLDLARFIRSRTGESKYCNAINAIKEDCHEQIDKMHDFGDILVYSYQQILSNNIDFTSQNIKYVIFDECHYFTSDAVFNPHTECTLNRLISSLMDSVRIYMSSTMETVFEPIIRTEVDLYQNKYKPKKDDRLCIHYYDLSRQYDYLNIKVWHKYEDILGRIKKDKNKWLIFVSSIDDGNKLKKKISEALNKDTSAKNEKGTSNKTKCESVEFITSDDKKSNVYKEIIKSEKLQDATQVLIATAVIDNGVNIKDESVTNIVIDVPDRVEFIQMLGRLRVKKDSDIKINLYIRDFDIQTLMSKWRFDANCLLDRMEYEMDGRIPREEQHKMLKISSDSQINEFALYQLVSRLEDLGRMIKALEPEKLLVLNESEGDRQLKIFDWIYNKNSERPLSRRICGILKDIKKGTLIEGDFRDGIRLYKYPVLSEKSFLQLIQEKRASALEHDAVEFIDKLGVYDFSKEKENRVNNISTGRYAFEPEFVPSTVQAFIDPNIVSVANSKNFYNELDKEAWYKKYPPDKISDMPWDIEDLWDKLKVAQFEEQLEIQKNGGSQKLPDADYMKAQCELYRDLAKNQIAGKKRPVILEQLHWLDMNTMSEINDDMPVNSDEEDDISVGRN